MASLSNRIKELKIELDSNSIKQRLYHGGIEEGEVNEEQVYEGSQVQQVRMSNQSQQLHSDMPRMLKQN